MCACRESRITAPVTSASSYTVVKAMLLRGMCKPCSIGSIGFPQFEEVDTANNFLAS